MGLASRRHRAVLWYKHVGPPATVLAVRSGINDLEIRLIALTSKLLSARFRQLEVSGSWHFMLCAGCEKPHTSTEELSRVPSNAPGRLSLSAVTPSASLQCRQIVPCAHVKELQSRPRIHTFLIRPAHTSSAPSFRSCGRFGRWVASTELDPSTKATWRLLDPINLDNPPLQPPL